MIKVMTHSNSVEGTNEIVTGCVHGQFKQVLVDKTVMTPSSGTR